MKRLNILTIISMVIIFFSCGGTKGVYSTKYIQVLEATKQTTHPGVQGIPSSQNFSIKVLVMKGGIENLGKATIYDVLGEKPLNTEMLRVYRNKQLLKDKAIEKGDTLDLFVSLMIPHDDDMEEEVKKEDFSPIDNKEKAELLFEYVVSGKTYVLGIKRVEKKEAVYAP